MIATTLASAARPFWRLLERYKVDPEFVFREAGLDPALMDKPRERYRFERRVAAWQKAAQLIDDPCFGLKIAEMWSPTDLHALGYAFLASSTLRAALGRLSRYAQVLYDALGMDLTDDGDQFCATLAFNRPVCCPLLGAQEDSIWAYVLRLCRACASEELAPQEVRLMHAEPPCRGDYYGFFRCPVRFDSRASEMLFARADVDRPLPASNKELAQANDQILADFLNKLRKEDLITRVKTAIARELPSGSPTDEAIAKTLFMSPRTLNRRLAAVGTNYSHLLEAVRRELAEQYVADPSMTLSEISFLLGFSEQSAFSRAFRRWRGQSPSAARSGGRT